MGREDNFQDFITELGCKKGSLPLIYLGLPLQARVWDGAKESFGKRQKAGYVEKMVHHERKEMHHHQKTFVEYASFYNIFVQYAQVSWGKAKNDLEESTLE